MIRICLSLNGQRNNGFVASIDGDGGGSIRLTDEPTEMTVATACAEAAAKLREAAARFDRLAATRGATLAVTQDRINRTSIASQSA
jgi:citrate lyase alpha subunit